MADWDAHRGQLCELTGSFRRHQVREVESINAGSDSIADKNIHCITHPQQQLQHADKRFVTIWSRHFYIPRTPPYSMEEDDNHLSKCKPGNRERCICHNTVRTTVPKTKGSKSIPSIEDAGIRPRDLTRRTLRRSNSGRGMSRTS
jgi:hypothetical protein